MACPRVEPSSAIRSRLLQRLARSRANSHQQREHSYLRHSPDRTVQSPTASHAHADPSLQTSLQPVTESISTIQELITAGFASLSETVQSNATSQQPSQPSQQALLDGHTQTQQRIDALTSRIDDLQSSNPQHELATVTHSIDALDLSPLEAIPPMAANIANCQETVNDIGQKMDNTHNDIQRLATHLNEVNDSVQKHDGALAESAASARDCQDTVNDIARKVDTTHGEVQSLTTNFDQLRESISKHDEALVESAVTGLRPLIDTVNEKISVMQNNFLDLAARTEASLNSLRDEIRTMQGSITSDVRSTLEAQSKELETLHSDLTSQHELLKTGLDRNAALGEQDRELRLQEIKVLEDVTGSIRAQTERMSSPNTHQSVDAEPTPEPTPAAATPSSLTEIAIGTGTSAQAMSPSPSRDSLADELERHEANARDSNGNASDKPSSEVDLGYNLAADFYKKRRGTLSGYQSEM
ncbi:hypothetical protein KCU71_g2692, partial [Aureobasidium melanogenum]